MAESLMFVSCGIDSVRVFQHRFDDFPGAVLKHPVKAALAASVAGDTAQLFNHQDDYVSVAVQAHFMQFLHMPGFFTLTPEFAARA